MLRCWFLLRGPAPGLMIYYGHLELLIIFKKEALHFHFALSFKDLRWWSWRLGEDGVCDLGQRSRPKALGREAGGSHRLGLISAATMLGSAASIDACTCSHPLLASNRCPETLPSSSHLPTGDSLLFNGHHSQAPLKPALTWRGAPVWKGKPGPNSERAMERGKLTPVQKCHWLPASLLSLCICSPSRS